MALCFKMKGTCIELRENRTKLNREEQVEYNPTLQGQGFLIIYYNQLLYGLLKSWSIPVAAWKLSFLLPHSPLSPRGDVFFTQKEWKRG